MTDEKRKACDYVAIAIQKEYDQSMRHLMFLKGSISADPNIPEAIKSKVESLVAANTPLPK